MDRTVYIEIAGKEYPMRFSVGASIEISKKFGSMQKMAEQMKSEEGIDEIKAFQTITWLLELFIRQGCAYKNLFETDIPQPDNAPIKEGKYIPLTQDEIIVGVDSLSLGEVKNKIFAVIGAGTKREVLGEEKKDNKKNVEKAMQG